MRHEREIVGKEKDRLVSREYRIKRRNQVGFDEDVSYIFPLFVDNRVVDCYYRPQELTDDHKSLSRLVEELREKYRRADERVRNDGSVKQKLKDTVNTAVYNGMKIEI